MSKSVNPIYTLAIICDQRVINQSIGNITDSFMLKSKKLPNKQHPKSKKIPQLLIPLNYHTEEITIPTISSMDLKSFNKTIDLKKAYTLHTKKSISRKSTNQSIKPAAALNSPNCNRLLKNFKELKLIHQNSSKSPKSCKSKSATKNKANKTSFKTLKSNTLTIKNSGLKLQRTLKKLNLTDLFREELSQLPIESFSDAVSQQQNSQLIHIDDDQVINLTEVRQFCSTVGYSSKKSISLTRKNIDIFKQNKAALKIQRAWKRFRTKMIIERYMSFIKTRLSSRLNQEQSSQELQDENVSEIKLASSDLYHEDSQSAVRQISSLSSKAKQQNPKHAEDIESVKHQQLNRWNEILAIIREANRTNPSDLQKLIATITEKSQINRKNLQQCTSARKKSTTNIQIQQNVVIPLAKQKIDEVPLPKLPIEIIKTNEHVKQGTKKYHISPVSRSQNSVEEHQQYNCRKYVNYLDCDVYPNDSDIVLGKQAKLQQIINRSTISKRKQQILLQILKNEHGSNHLGDNKLICSNSLVILKPRPKHSTEASVLSNPRSNLTKANSQKMLRRSLQCCMEEQPNEDYCRNVDLQRQFLEEGKIDNNDVRKVHHFVVDIPHNQNFENQEEQFFALKGKTDNNVEKQVNEAIFQRSDQALGMYPDDHSQLNFFKMHSVQHQQAQQKKTYDLEYQQEMISCQKSEEEPSDKQQDIHDISILIFNSMILECLKDISRSDEMAKSFKAFSQNARIKIRKGQLGFKKRGFPTDKKEIESFLQCIINYLKTYQPSIFLNLQVPTGPSALEMLRYMHDSSQQESVSDCNDDDEANIMVIPNRIFQLFWQLKEKSIIVEVPPTFNESHSASFKQNFEYLKNFNKIFYRSLFDTLNECLDYNRNYGQLGRPFPWKQTPMFQRQFSQSRIQFGIISARKRMMELVTTYCGLIIEKEDMNDLGGNEEYITQVQEDRLSRMLANDLIDCEGKWIFYDDEEAEILIELSDTVYKQIFDEFVQELYVLL